MEDNNDSQTTTTSNLEPTARSRGRPRRPTAQKSVHQLVLNLTQNNEKKNQQNVNKKQKTSESEVLTTTQTTITTPKTTNDWKVGQKVEARDVAGDWYSAKIVSKSEDEERVLVHFERWSARYDQWFLEILNSLERRARVRARAPTVSPSLFFMKRFWRVGQTIGRIRRLLLKSILNRDLFWFYSSTDIERK